MSGIELTDVIGAIGLALVVAGVTRWSLSCGLITAGVMLFAIAYVSTGKGKKAN